MSAQAVTRRTATVVVNPVGCVAHGVCAELFPERISLDEWGYPIVDPRPIPEHLIEHARRAAGACPTLALIVTDTAPIDRPASATRPHPLALLPQPARESIRAGRCTALLEGLPALPVLRTLSANSSDRVQRSGGRSDLRWLRSERRSRPLEPPQVRVPGS